MSFPANDRPYFDAWLRRTSRQLAVSGRLTQTATALAAEAGGTVEGWRSRLRILLEGQEIPSLDLLMRIDAILAGSPKAKPGEANQESLF